MIVTQNDARKIITKHYPGMPFKLTPKVTIGVRPVIETELGKLTLVWQKLLPGKTSAVKIGVLQRNLTIDWNAEVK